MGAAPHLSLEEKIYYYINYININKDLRIFKIIIDKIIIDLRLLY